MAASTHFRLGATALAATLIIDQACKLVMLHVVDIETRGVIRVTPFFDLVMAWNYGVSFGLFQQDDPIGQWALAAFKAVAVVALAVWLWRSETRLTALAVGMIAGGAAGNAIDRVAYGAVADFFAFHVTTETWRFNWYVFNLADVAIVAGVALLLYEAVNGAWPTASKSA